jgi:PAS domain S-box-containing protein
MRRSQTLQRTQVVAAVVCTAVIFAVDLSAAPEFAIGALYVVPLLLNAFASPLQTAITEAWVASTLIVAGLAVKAFNAPVAAAAILNRGIALAVVWTTAVVVARSRRATDRLETQTRDLADMRYAIDQSAIVATTNTKGTITFVNDKFCEISKFSREELLGQDHRILNSGHHPKEFIRTLWTTIANGHIWRGELRNRAKDGSIYWVDTTIVPFLDDRGKPYQYMAIRYEITARKQQEALLREQAALTRLGEMAAVVAHEVKNPIAGIRGALQVIVGRMPADQRDRSIIGEIIARLDALNGIVQDLLLFARPRQVKREPVDLHSLTSNIVEMLKRDPALAAIDVQISGSPAAIPADPEQLRIVLQNLLMNAAQAMGGRGVIEVSLVADDGGSQVLVRDHGPGMPAEVRDKAFDAFFTTKHRGTGLGLPIARRVVEAHGGDIDISTPDGGGTVVSIRLPKSEVRSLKSEV